LKKQGLKNQNPGVQTSSNQLSQPSFKHFSNNLLKKVKRKDKEICPKIFWKISNI